MTYAETMARVQRERVTEKRVRSMDASDIVEEVHRLEDQNKLLVTALEKARDELAALLVNPKEYAPGDWPVSNPADGECLTRAYDAIETALFDASN